VIDGSYNQTSRTRGVLFCARKVWWQTLVSPHLLRQL
jgi:hypothetical protein